MLQGLALCRPHCTRFGDRTDGDEDEKNDPQDENDLEDDDDPRQRGEDVGDDPHRETDGERRGRRIEAAEDGREAERRIEAEGREGLLMEREPVNSLIISEIGYNAACRTLEILFKSGAIYLFYFVPEEIHRDFMNAQYIGDYWAKNVKHVYECSRIAKPYPRKRRRTG